MAPAPINRGSWYARLDECVANLARSLGLYDVVTYMDPSFYKYIVGVLRDTCCYTHGVFCYNVRWGGSRQSDEKHFQGLRAMMAGRKQSSKKSLSAVIDSEGNFNFRPYVYVLIEVASSGTSLVPESSTPAKAQFLLDIIAPASLPFMLESKKGGKVYNPQRVMR